MLLYGLLVGPILHGPWGENIRASCIDSRTKIHGVFEISQGNQMVIINLV